MADKDKAITLRISRRELATIVAALRFHQDENLQGGHGIADQAIPQIATDGDALQTPDFQEVERLCRKLNLGEDRRTPAELAVGPPPRQGGPEPLLRAVYAIDVNAASPLDAARKAHRLMVDPDSQLPVLDVVDPKGNVARIDLSEEAMEPSAVYVHPAIRRIHDLLYLDIRAGKCVYDPQKSWTPDTMAAIAEVVAEFIPAGAAP